MVYLWETNTLNLRGYTCRDNLSLHDSGEGEIISLLTWVPRRSGPEGPLHKLLRSVRPPHTPTSRSVYYPRGPETLSHGRNP